MGGGVRIHQIAPSRGFSSPHRCARSRSRVLWIGIGDGGNDGSGGRQPALVPQPLVFVSFSTRAQAVYRPGTYRHRIKTGGVRPFLFSWPPGSTTTCRATRAAPATAQRNEIEMFAYLSEALVSLLRARAPWGSSSRRFRGTDGRVCARARTSPWIVGHSARRALDSFTNRREGQSLVCKGGREASWSAAKAKLGSAASASVDARGLGFARRGAGQGGAKREAAAGTPLPLRCIAPRRGAH